MRLLIVEDEKDLNKLICKKLTSEGYLVDACFDGESAYEYALVEEFDGIILDVMLPKMNGFEMLKKLRTAGNQTPVLFLSAMGESMDIVKGLDYGACDYMVKPFNFQELMARIRVMLRSTSVVNENIYRCGDLELNVNERVARRGGNVIELTAKEYSVLEYMMRNQSIVLTRTQIEANIWNIDNDIGSNVIDVYIRFLRKKIDEDYEIKLIHTVRGVGYILKCEE